MPRPLKEPPKPLSKVIRLRLTPEQYEKVQTVATSAGMTVSEVMRRKLSGIRIPDRSDAIQICELRILHGELARQGGLVKHIYSDHPEDKILLDKTLNELTDAAGRVRKMVTKLENDYKNTPENRR